MAKIKKDDKAQAADAINDKAQAAYANDKAQDAWLQEGERKLLLWYNLLMPLYAGDLGGGVCPPFFLIICNTNCSLSKWLPPPPL